MDHRHDGLDDGNHAQEGSRTNFADENEIQRDEQIDQNVGRKDLPLFLEERQDDGANGGTDAQNLTDDVIHRLLLILFAVTPQGNTCSQGGGGVGQETGRTFRQGIDGPKGAADQQTLAGGLFVGGVNGGHHQAGTGQGCQFQQRGKGKGRGESHNGKHANQAKDQIEETKQDNFPLAGGSSPGFMTDGTKRLHNAYKTQQSAGTELANDIPLQIDRLFSFLRFLHSHQYQNHVSVI